MPVFEINGKKYNVRDEHIDSFIKDFPDASTIMEREGKKYRVKSADYKTFMGETVEPLTGFGEGVKQGAESLYQGGRYAVAEFAGPKKQHYQDALDYISQEGFNAETFDKDKAYKEDRLQRFDRKIAEWRQEKGKRAKERENLGFFDSLIHKFNDPSMPRMNDYDEYNVDEEMKSQRRFNIVEATLKEAGGDLAKAKELLKKRASKETWSDRQQREASEALSQMKPVEGAAWWGQMVPQVGMQGLSLLSSASPYTRWLAKPLAVTSTMGLTLSSSGSAMDEARKAGATDSEVLTAGAWQAGIEYISEKIPLDKLLGKFGGATFRKEVSERLLSEANKGLGGKLAKEEAERLLTEANKKLGGKLISGQTVKEFVKNMSVEGLSEFIAEGAGTFVPLVYENSENYPTLSETLSNAWEGAKGGLAMGGFLGGGSMVLANRANNARRKKQGFVTLAETDDGVVEILGSDGANAQVLTSGGEVETVPVANLQKQYSYTYDAWKKGEVNSVLFNAQEAFGNAYKTTDAQGMASIKKTMEGARAAISFLSDEAVQRLDENPVPTLELMESEGATDEELQAVRDYVNASAAYNGMVQRVRDDMESRVEDSNAIVESRKNRTTGLIQGATMKQDDRRVYVINGNIVQYADGSGIDKNASDKSIIVRDAETGALEQVSPDAILNIDETLDPTTEMQTAAEAIRQQYAQEVANRIDGVVTSTEETQQASTTQPVAAQYNYNDEITILDDNNQPVRATIVSNADADGRMQVETGTPVNGKRVNYLTAEEINGRLYEAPGELVTLNDGQQTEQSAPTKEPIPMEKVGKEERPAYHLVPIERTLEELHGDADLTQQDIDAFITANITELQGEIKKVAEKEPKMGANIAKFKQDKIQWAEKQKALQAKLDYYTELQKRNAELNSSELQEAYNASGSVEGVTTPDEVVAGLLGSIKITPESFKRETGLSTTEQKGLVGIIANEDKGGVSVERAAEIIAENYSDELAASGYTGDVQGVRDMVISVLSDGNPRTYAKRGAEQRANEEAESRRREIEAWVAQFDMTVEEYFLYEQTMLPRVMRDYQGFDENEYYSILADEYNNSNYDTERESESVGRGREVLQGEQPVPARGAEPVGAGNEGGTVPSDVQGGTANGANEQAQSVNSFDALPSEGDLGAANGVAQEEIGQPVGISEQLENGRQNALQNGANELNLQQNDTDNANETNISRGGQVSQSVPQGEHREVASLSGGAQEAAARLRERIESAQRDSKSGLHEVENRVTREFAQENGLWIENETELGTPFPSGDEHNNYIDVENQVVYKVNNRMHTPSILELLDRMEQHNKLFPNTQYKLVGFTSISKNGDVMPVFAQDFVPGARMATNEDIDAYMSALGFTPVGEARYTNGEIVVKDLRPRNVLADADGNIYVVDAEFEPAKQESGEKSAVPSVQEQIQAAEAEVNTNPTEAQKEAGNYKKGHVQIGTFNVTIEQPKGSVRSGVDADGKKWETEMQNTYGYIRGTEGVDGDHIDVFLSDDIDGWDGHKVFVVDQRNADGSFDEHKVMLGFNDINDAEAAYMSNYEEGWQGLGAITGVSIEEFEKWIASSYRKTKAFAEYKSVKTTEGQNASADKDLRRKLADFNVGDVVRDYYNQKLYRIKKHSTNGVSTIAELDAEGNEVGTTTMNAHNNSRYSLAEAPVKAETPTISQESEQVSDQDNAPYTIAPAQYTTKKGKVLDMHLVKFAGELTKEQQRAAKELAKADKGWYDREQGGFMMRSEDSAKQLAETIIGNEEAVSDAQPVSLADTRKVVKPQQVNVESLIGELTKKGETKLSDHVEQPTNPSGNRLVTDERYAELRERMRKKLGGQMNIGIDPEILAIGTEMAVYHLEKGARKFTEYAKAMIADLGDAIRPYLKAFYNGARELPEVAESGLANDMTPYDEVQRFDVTNFDKQGVDVFAAAETIVREQEVASEVETAKQEIINQRNTERRNEDEQTSANTEAIASQAETVADEAERIIDEATTEEEITEVEQQIDEQLNAIDEQLAKFNIDDLHSGMRVILKDGRNILLSMVMHSGEQLGAAQFSKPRVHRLYGIHKGQIVDISPADVDVDATRRLLEGNEVTPVEEETKQAKAKKSKKKAVNLQQNLLDLFDNGTEENTRTDNSGAQSESQKLPNTEQVGARTSVQHPAKNSESKRGNSGTGRNKLGDRPWYDVNKNYSNEEIGEIVSSITDIVDGKVVITGEVTDDIKAIIRGYKSGGVAKQGRGILDEYYTDGKIVDAVNMLIAPYFKGAKGVRVLEPSVGVGNFIEAVDNIPTSEIQAFEINDTTARIAKILYPGIDVNLRSFETEFIDESGNKKPLPKKFNLVIGNPPYGSYRGLYKGLGEESKIARYEDYFVKRSLDVLEDGGVLAMVLPSSWIDRHTKYGGYTIEAAYRLPSGAFEATQVGTDIVILKKDSTIPVTEHTPYFEQHPERVLGDVKERTGRYGRTEQYVEGNIDTALETIKREQAEQLAEQLDIEKSNDNLNDIEAAIEETGSIEKATPIVESEKAERKPAKKSSKPSKYKVELNRGVETVPTSSQFTHEFSEGEVEAFADTEYDGTLNNPTRHKKYANYIGGRAVHDFYYAEGDIYDKLAQLEREKGSITEAYGIEQYNKQKILLESVLPKRKGLSEITVSPNTTFVKNLNIETAEGSVSLKDAFIAFCRNLPHQAFGDSSSWEVVGYVNNEQVHGTDKHRNQRVRERRKRVANDLFAKFLNEELSDKAKNQVVAAFNSEYNSVYRPDYSKVPMFSTINKIFKDKPLKLTDVQLAGIGRMTVKGVGVLAHEVGFGKTLSGILAMHEAMTRGFAKKPLIVVPNDNILKQWVETINEVLPQATVNTLGNLGTGYDLTDFKVNDGEFTIVTYEGLKAMSFSDDTYNRLADRFSYITEDLKKHQSERDVQKRIEKQNELKGKMKRGAKATYGFEDFGFDWLTVDEVHNANHIVSKVRLDKSVASDFRSQSQRTSDLGLKTWLAAQYIQEENNGRNVLLLSATPFTNKPLEYYSILSLVGNKMLERKGFFNVDQFFATFMEADNEMEMGANNRPVQKTNVRRFRNNGLFQQLLSEFIDIKGEEDNPELIRPARHNREYKLAQNDLTAEAIDAAQELLNDNDTVLQGIGHARAAAFSPYATSLLGAHPKNHKEFVKNSPKIDATIKMIEQNRQDRPDAGQIIYSEVGVEFFPMIRDYLVKESGFKPNEVRIITGATSNNERVNIQTAFNNGEVKVVIGSPAIKEGLNLQGNTTDMYILSLPWNFTQLRQIEGRGWRQGNKWENIRINYMLTNNSVDVFMLQRLQLKQGLYNEAMKSGAESLDVSDIDTAELKTALITDPAVRAEIVTAQEREKLQMEKTQIEADLSFVVRKYEAYNKLISKLDSQKRTVKQYREWAKNGDNYWVERAEREEAAVQAIEQEIEQEKENLAKKGVNVDDIVRQTEQAQSAIAAIQERIDNLKEFQQELTERFRKENEAKEKLQGDVLATYLKERKAENNSGFYKIRPKEKPKTAEEGDVLYRTSEEIETEYPNWLDGTTTDSGKHSTQVEGTRKTYKKVGDWIEQNLGKDVAILDASSGMGYGTADLRERGFNIEDVEPYQSEERKRNNPATYSSYDDIDKQYDYIISNAVLNVIPDDWRAGVLHDMADKLKVGGKIFINTRKAGEEKTIKDKIELDSPREVLVKRNGKIAAYQRFFTPQELKEWVESELGDEFTVEIANNANSGTNGLAAVVVTKNGDILFRDWYGSRDYREFREIQEGVSNRQYEKAKEVLQALKTAGHNDFHISRSITDFGVSTYIIGNYGTAYEGMKFRISDHGVSSERRILTESFFDYNTPVSDIVAEVGARKEQRDRIAIERARLESEAESKRKTLDEKWERIKHYFDGLEFHRNNRTYQHFDKFASDTSRSNILQKDLGDGAFSYEYTSMPNGYGSKKPSYEFIEAFDEQQAEVVTTRLREGYGPASDSEVATESDVYAKALGRPRYTGRKMREYVAGQRQKMVERANELAEKLHLDNVEVVTDASTLEGKKQRAKGFYRKSTGKITIVIPNHSSVADVEQTLLHEAVAHYGLRQLFGESFDTFLDNVYYNASEEIRAEIDRLAMEKYDGETRTATEEYLASLAENTNFENAERSSWWQKIKRFFVDMLAKAGVKLDAPLTDNELRYILWRSYENLAEPGRYRSILGEAADVAKQYELGVGNYSDTNLNPNFAAESDDDLYRDGGPEIHERELARDRYERRVKTGMFQSQEALQDSMLSLKVAMQEIVGKDVYIEDIADFENAYLGENRLSSVNKAEADAFAHTLFKPMLDEVAKLAKTEQEREVLTDYMMAKHGLERNRAMAERDAKVYVETEIGKLKKELRRKEITKEEIEEINKKINLLNAKLDGVTKNLSERDAQIWYNIQKNSIDILRRNGKIGKAEYKKRIKRLNKIFEEGYIGLNRDRDYAGLTALTNTKNVADAEAEAQRIIEDYELAHETTDLWEKVNAVNKAILSKQYECGLMDKKTYDKISNMYKFYIPLRGFDEGTSADVYAYLMHKESSFNAPIRKAYGRSSKADDPFSNLQSIAESSIMQGNRNKLVKQRFLNFVLNNPSDLVSVNKLWLEYDEMNDEWKPVFPNNISSNDSPQMVEKKMQAFEVRMKELAEEFPNRYKSGSDAKGIPYRVLNANLGEHQVIVKRGGVDYVLTVNGNPRLAQAVNGQTNPDNDLSGAIGAILRAGEEINRRLSALYTTRNPDFVVSNFVRDMLYSNTMAWIKESPNYALRFHRNYLMVNPVTMKQLLAKHRKGALDMSNRIDAMFHQFMMNGGETGYANIRDIEQHKNDIKRELKRSYGKLKITRAMSLLAEKLDELNRAVENCARFAAFITSREMGRSIGRAIYDAKEVSVNFNKKGSGAKFYDSVGQTTAGNASAFVSGLGRSGYVFWNAAIQGATNFGRQMKRHPAKAFTGVATMFLLGAIVAYLGGDDEEDDKNAYYNLPEYVRRSNILFRAGDSWISIPLPIEYKAFYGMGELMTSVFSGKERLNGGEIAEAILEQATQILPIDFLEGGGGLNTFVPSVAKPLWEAYFVKKSWTGMPLYKDTPYNKDMPEWTKAYKNTNRYIVNLSATLNEATGGDKITKGAIDFNPAKVEYLLNGYFGGVFGTIDKLTKTAEIIAGDREYDPRSILLANRLVKAGDERTEYRAVNNEYSRLEKEYENTKRRLRNYERDTDMGVFDYAEKIDFLYNSPEYARYEIFEGYRRDINYLYEALKEAAKLNDENSVKELEAELNELKKEMIKEMDTVR